MSDCEDHVSTRDEDFTEFASARWLPLVRAAMALGCPLTEAEDLAQTTLLRAYVSWEKVLKAHSLDAYVSKMLLNAFRDSHRRRWRRETPMAEVPDSPLTDPDVERADALRRAVRSLNQGQREVLALRYFVRLNEAEIATTLNIAQGTVKSRLSRALATLATHADLAETESADE